MSLILVQTDVEHRHHGHHKEGGENHHKVSGEQQQGERGLDLTSEILNSNLVGRETVEVGFSETHLLPPHDFITDPFQSASENADEKHRHSKHKDGKKHHKHKGHEGRDTTVSP